MSVGSTAVKLGPWEERIVADLLDRVSRLEDENVRLRRRLEVVEGLVGPDQHKLILARGTSAEDLLASGVVGSLEMSDEERDAFLKRARRWRRTEPE